MSETRFTSSDVFDERRDGSKPLFLNVGCASFEMAMAGQDPPYGLMARRREEPPLKKGAGVRAADDGDLLLLPLFEKQKQIPLSPPFVKGR